MNKQPRGTARHWVALACVLAGLATWRIGGASFSHVPARSWPRQFSGDWVAVGVQGDSRGTMTFMPDGRVDSHDDYAGRLWVESGAMHVQFWSAAPLSLVGHLRPDRDEYVLAVTRDKDHLPAIMHGVSVVLTPSGNRGQP